MDPAPKIALLLKFPETDIRIFVTLIASILFAYPYSVISRKLSPTHQHLLNTITGIAFLYYCYGIGIIHLLFDICLIAVLLNVAGGTIGSVLFTWVWVFGHLLWGYSQQTMINDVLENNIVISQCVLTLKLIGVATSLYDAKIGKKVDEKSSIDSLFALTSSKIQVLEVMGFCCLFCTCIIGPQLSFRRYREFVNGTLYDREKVGGNVYYAINRAALAVFYCIIYLVLNSLLPSVHHLITPTFAKEPFWKKMILNVGMFILLFKRYMMLWLISEVSCISFGISYVKNKDGSHNWRGFRNVKPWEWETMTSGMQMFSSMNCSVNVWIIYYILKRLKFLKLPLLSNLVMSLFVSLWHGLYFGYFQTFFFQIPIIYFDRIVHKFIRTYFGEPNEWLLHNRIVFTLTYVIYLNTIESFNSSFSLLTLERSLQYFKAVNYFGFWIIIAEIPIGIFLNFLIRRSESSKKSM